MLPDWKIRELAQQEEMITPFVEKQTANGVISYGLSSYGYDCRLADKFKIFNDIHPSRFDDHVIDPKRDMGYYFIEHQGDTCIIPPNSYILAHTVERFRIPRNVLAICLGKSTYARWGIIVNVTPLEPEWEGVVTLEISNATPSPVKIYANEGICQMVFLCTEQYAPPECEVSYADRKGKYQNQEGITLGKIRP